MEHGLDEAVVAPNVVGQGLRGDHLVGAAVGILQALVAPLAGRVQVLVDLVQQPEQKLLSVVLRGAAELRSIPVHHGLEAGAVVALVLAGPQGLQDIGQLFGELPLGAELSGIDLVSSLQVDLVDRTH